MERLIPIFEAAKQLQITLAIGYEYDLIFVEPGVMGTLPGGRRVMRGWDAQDGAWRSFYLDQFTSLSGGFKHFNLRSRYPRLKRHAPLVSVDWSVE